MMIGQHQAGRRDERARAAAGKTGEDYSKAEKAVKSDIEKECVGSDTEHSRCDVVALYHGGIYDVYKYHRYQDVRLVFAPELAMAFFGGDPDNFNFPRYDLDMGVLRAYENDKPAKVADFFPFSKSGAEEGEMTVTVGNPGGTDRQLTIAQLDTTRDIDAVHVLMRLAEMRGLLEQFRSESAEHARIAQSDLFGVENSYKAYIGRLQALQDPEVANVKRKQEAELRDYVNADATRKGIEKSKEAAAQLQEKAGDYYEVSREKASEFYQTATEKAADLTEKAKSVAANTANPFSAAIEAGKDAYTAEKRKNESKAITEGRASYPVKDEGEKN